MTPPADPEAFKRYFLNEYLQLCREFGVMVIMVPPAGNPDRSVPAVADFGNDPSAFETYARELRAEPYRTVMPPREAEEARAAERHEA